MLKRRQMGMCKFDSIETHASTRFVQAGDHHYNPGANPQQPVSLPVTGCTSRDLTSRSSAAPPLTTLTTTPRSLLTLPRIVAVYHLWLPLTHPPRCASVQPRLARPQTPEPGQQQELRWLQRNPPYRPHRPIPLCWVSAERATPLKMNLSCSNPLLA